MVFRCFRYPCAGGRSVCFLWARYFTDKQQSSPAMGKRNLRRDQGTTLFLAGRLAFRRNDAELMKILLSGLIVWLVVEAIFSFYLGVFFNVGVDLAVLALFSFPLMFL